MHIQWYTVYIITIYNVYTCITIYNVYTCPPDQLIRQGSAQGLAGIRCYSFFLRNWLSGLLTTWQRTFNCLPNSHFFVDSRQPQHWLHCVWQSICLASPWNDACLVQDSHCGPDNGVARRAANKAVPFMHRHPCAADQWLDGKGCLYSLCGQAGSTVASIPGLSIHGLWWAVHGNHVSYNPVHNVLVSQRSTTGNGQGVFIQGHTGNTLGVKNGASSAVESRWNCARPMQRQSKYIHCIHIEYTLNV